MVQIIRFGLCWPQKCGAVIIPDGWSVAWEHVRRATCWNGHRTCLLQMTLGIWARNDLIFWSFAWLCFVIRSISQRDGNAKRCLAVHNQYWAKSNNGQCSIALAHPWQQFDCASVFLFVINIRYDFYIIEDILKYFRYMNDITIVYFLRWLLLLLPCELNVSSNATYSWPYSSKYVVHWIICKMKFA